MPRVPRGVREKSLDWFLLGLWSPVLLFVAVISIHRWWERGEAFPLVTSRPRLRNEQGG